MRIANLSLRLNSRAGSDGVLVERAKTQAHDTSDRNIVKNRPMMVVTEVISTRQNGSGCLRIHASLCADEERGVKRGLKKIGNLVGC